MFEEYLKSVSKDLTAGNATEHTYRAALTRLLESFEPSVAATNEPKRTAVGAPDYIVARNREPLGYVEAKDVGVDLRKTERSEQLGRYRAAFSNLILTDYLEFRHYVNGELRSTARLADVRADGKLSAIKGGEEEARRLLGNFFSAEPASVGTPRELAGQMAARAREIRDLIRNTFEQEGARGQLHGQLSAFRKTLIPDLKPEDFADMYAQTIAYGLFAARTTSDEQNFTRWSAAGYLPNTNPFLQKLFYEISGPNLDERVAWMVDDLAELLRRADMSAILRDFGSRTRREDPVVHFYETFLAAYDPKMREARGVYYTPEPVVSYIVRSVDYLLKEKFGRSSGLADENTRILDPATGTATFLYYAIRHIHDELERQGQLGGWNAYVREDLLPRIFGFELLMAPYTVAHMKLGVLLQELGYDFSGDERLGVYLTNTLEEGGHAEPVGSAEYIADEANAAAKVKNEEPIEVIIGNPPYSEESANKGDWISSLINDYKKIDGKPLGERNPKALLNDYVKFIRFGQWRIQKTGQGILAFITSHTYLDSVIFRGMRQSLMETFSDIYILNLHGDIRARESSPDGSKDGNVFDQVQTGVSICFSIKELGKTGASNVYHCDLWGNRKGKDTWLAEEHLDSTRWSSLSPASPSYSFVSSESDFALEWEKAPSVTEIFKDSTLGFKTHRDHFAVAFDEATIKSRISDFHSTAVSDEELEGRYKISSSRDWSLNGARSIVRNDDDWPSKLTPCLFRPFDIRHCYLSEVAMDRPRPGLAAHALRENFMLVVGRQGQVIGPDEWQVIHATQYPADMNLYRRGGNQIFPLYLYPDQGSEQYFREDVREKVERDLNAAVRRDEITATEGSKRIERIRTSLKQYFPEEASRWPNLAPEFVMDLSERLGLSFVADGKGDLARSFGPEDVFHYAYAIFHSPTYRTRHAEFLKRDFPRLPLTSDTALFVALAGKGEELVGLHLMTSPKLGDLVTRFPEGGDGVVEKVRYDHANGRVYINRTQHFEGVPETIWGFRVGGYQVLDKWLKDRKGRALSSDDIRHYQRTAVAISETMRLMREIDETIPGWPLG